MGKLVKAISADGGILMTAVDSTDIVYRAEQIHKTSATVTAALGRLLRAHNPKVTGSNPVPAIYVPW